jgi:carboxyl-terminal processing protease
MRFLSKIRHFSQILSLVLSLGYIFSAGTVLLHANDTPWSKTVLPFSLIESKLTDDFCKSSDAEYLACTATLLVLNNPNQSNSKLRDLLVSAMKIDRSKRNFSKSFQNIRESKLTFTNESEITALAYNTYLANRFDPHTQIYPKSEIQNYFDPAKRDYIGLGLFLSKTKSGQIKIDRIHYGSPVETLRVGDKIIKVDGCEIDATESVESLSSKLKGPENTSVKITVLRGKETLDLEVIRKRFDLSLVSKTLSFLDKSYGYLRLIDLADSTLCEKIKTEVTKFSETKNMNGIILDLRDNPGGEIRITSCVLGLWTGPGMRTVTEHSAITDELIFESVTSENKIIPWKTVVLVNSQTASAAEILAGALQDYADTSKLDILIAGQPTYGKATVQTPPNFLGMDLRPQEIKPFDVDYLMTFSKYKLPSGRSIFITGVRQSP